MGREYHFCLWALKVMLLCYISGVINLSFRVKPVLQVNKKNSFWNMISKLFVSNAALLVINLNYYMSVSFFSMNTNRTTDDHDAMNTVERTVMNMIKLARCYQLWVLHQFGFCNNHKTSSFYKNLFSLCTLHVYILYTCTWKITQLKLLALHGNHVPF